MWTSSIIAISLLCCMSTEPLGRRDRAVGNGHRHRDLDAQVGAGQGRHRRVSLFSDKGAAAQTEALPSVTNTTSVRLSQDLTTAAADGGQTRLTARDVELSIVSDVYSPAGELSIAVSLDSPPAELSVSSKWSTSDGEPPSEPGQGAPLTQEQLVTQLQEELSTLTNAAESVPSAPISTNAPNPCQGQTKPLEGPCLKCRCATHFNPPKYECAVTECMRGQCVDGHIPPGECCPVCPNGRNCDANGQIIPFGQTVTMDNGDQCYCANIDGRWGELEAVCMSEPIPPDYPA